jgi:hypothetical protein
MRHLREEVVAGASRKTSRVTERNTEEGSANRIADTARVEKL